MSRFDRALVCPPSATFAAGLTQAALGAPDLGRARAQHEAYCAALAEAGLELVRLPPEEQHPDSTFVEDTAIVTARGAVLTRPGAASRAGETRAIEAALRRLGVPIVELDAPGHVDGGDVCEVDGHFLIGRSSRTDEAGARQLADRLERWGFTSATLDVRALGPALLHLKSGLSELGSGRLVVVPELAEHPVLAGYEQVVVDVEEAYAANCVRVNDRLLVADGFPRLAAELERRGERVVRLDMSEFRKMDGGLSCLSLRLPAGLPRGAASA